jgi:hypothetical protein
MKISELKKLIRQNIIQELSTDDTISEYDFLSEKKKDDEKATPDAETEEATPDAETEEATSDVEIEEEPPATEEPAADTSSAEDSNLSDSDQEYLDALEDLKNKAKEMGDEKLENQIDNTITYFTRQHVVKEGDKSLMENHERRRLQVIAGIIK